MNRHFTNDEMIGMLYGVVDTSDRHLDTCRACAQRWSEMQARRAEATRPLEIPAPVLAAQRERILTRLEQPGAFGRSWVLKWAPAVAVAFLMAVGVFLSRPTPPPPPVSTETDSQLFTDVFAMEESVEPRAAAPIRALFEGEQ